MPRRTAPFPFTEHRACVTLTELSTAQLPKDGSVGRRRRFRGGTEIWRPDSPADRVYFLEQGEVSVFSADVHGNDLLLQVVTPPQWFGELCLCAEEGGLRRTFARAAASAIAIEITNEAFLRYLMASPGAVTSALYTFCVRLSDCETRTDVLAHRGAHERLGRLLLQLSAKAASTSADGREALVRTTHAELARLAAMSRPHVTVTLGHFRTQRLIRYGRGTPLVVRRDLLAQYLESAVDSSS